MKKLLILTFFIFLQILNANTQKSFKISYDPDYAPFSYKSEGKAQGLLVDIWKLWAKKNSYKVEFVDGRLWEDAIELAKNGKVDFFLGTEVYEEWMRGSVEIYRAKTSFFSPQNFYGNITPSSSATVGIVGTDYESLINENFPNFKIAFFDSYESLFKNFLEKKIDLVFDDKLAIEFYALQNRYIHHIKPLNCFDNSFIVQAVSIDPSKIELFNKGFEKISQSDLETIEDKWLIGTVPGEDIKGKLLLTKEEKSFLKGRVINVSVSKSWKPFSFQSLKGKFPEGFSSEVWELLSKKLNIKSKYTFEQSFTKQLESVKTKQNDVIFSTGETEDREEYALFTKKYISFPISIATLKDENFIENIDAISNKKIAVGKNFTAHRMLKKNYPGLNFYLVDSIKDGLEAVRNKKAYAFVDIEPSLKYNINKLGMEKVRISGNTGLEFDMKIMVRDDYPLLVSALNKAIDTLGEDDMRMIILKWNNIQFEKDFNKEALVLLSALFILIVSALAIRAIISHNTNKKLKNLVDEKTKELKGLNENLENLVAQQTRKLRISKELLDEAQQIAHLGSYKYDLVSKNLTWSKEHFRILDLDPYTIKPTLELYLSYIYPEDKKSVLENIDYKNYNDEKKVFSYRLLFEDKTIKYVQSTAQIKYDENSKPLSIVGTILDISELKRLELEKIEKENLLTQQAKMAAMGEMLENIAHQWRQPLSIISTSATGLQVHKQLGSLEDEMMDDSLNSIEKSAQYLSKTIDDFRNFFKQSKEFTPFEAAQVFDKCCVIVNSRLSKSGIKVIKNIDNIQIKTLENELIQVLMNLFKNSIDVLEESSHERKYIFIDVYKNGSRVNIEFKDNGGGIDEKIITRIFEPYFTTKHKSQGTGIGLYMSFEIIIKHLKGSFTVENSVYKYENEEYKGAKFSISLPLG